MKKNIIIGRNLLETITSALYENPIILFREYTQNSLDAYNDSVRKLGKPEVTDFKVEISIEEIEKRIVIKDNGYGIESEDKFKEDMLGFGNSDKSDRTQFIGFRGIGRISALPFCKKLTFVNKIKGSIDEQVCIWEGEKYRNILNDIHASHSTFEEIISEIVSINTVASDSTKEEHFFKVIIDNYSNEIEEVIGNYNFEQQLRKLLPIKYTDDFSVSKKILEKYKEFMNEELTDFMCSVYLNDRELRKNYTNSNHVLDSNIVFWEVYGKNREKEQKGEKIGIIWFSFNRKMTSTKNDSDYGILVRSKNVLMGNNNTFADLCQNSKEHVATYSELTATLRGVYGELLINSINLKDNARREWFKTDEYSIYLKYVIIDYMRRLYKYRYAASHYFRKNAHDKETKQKQNLKDSLLELIDINTNDIDISDFYDDEAKESLEEQNSEPKEKKNDKFADEDIPRQSQTKKKNYDELLEVIKEFFEKEEMYDIFLKLRAYIKKHFQD